MGAMKKTVKVDTKNFKLKDLSKVVDIGVFSPIPHKQEKLKAPKQVVAGLPAVAQGYKSTTDMVTVAKSVDKKFGAFSRPKINKGIWDKLIKNVIAYTAVKSRLSKKNVQRLGIALVTTPILEGKYKNTAKRAWAKGFNKGAFSTGQLVKNINAKIK